MNRGSHGALNQFGKRAGASRCEPRYDLDPETGDSIEIFAREPSPACPTGGWGRNAGRPIHLHEQTIANGWTLRPNVDRDAGALDQCATVQRCAALGTKVKADFAPRSSAGRARNFIPKQSESYTVSRSAANSDIPINSLSSITVGRIDLRSWHGLPGLRGVMDHPLSISSARNKEVRMRP